MRRVGSTDGADEGAVRRMLSISMSMFLHGAIALAATIASPSRNRFANRSIALASSRSHSARSPAESRRRPPRAAADGDAHEAGGADDDHATRFDRRWLEVAQHQAFS